MDDSTWQLFAAGGLIAVLGVIAIIASRRDKQVVTGERNPAPRVDLSGISRAERRERDAFVALQLVSLNQIPWGEHAISDRREAERIYLEALDAISDAEGDYRKLSPVVEQLETLPLDLAYSGIARIMMTLAYYRKGQYSPFGLQTALAYTSAAIDHDPLSVDAWIMRLHVTTSIPDLTYRRIAREALKQVQTLNPNHPNFPSAEAAYYKLYGTKDQYQAALQRMLELAPSPVVKRAAFDRLAWHYAERNRLDDAIATYQQYFREFPEGSAWTWHNYSILLQATKRYEEALDASNHALAFFEFPAARGVNNAVRKALGMPPGEPARVDD